MSISEAIARVRQGATRSRASLLDGALSYLGVRLKTDLAARLKSDSVPSPLRPLATRLASLIKLTDPPPYDDAAKQQLEVVSLDRALARAAQQQRTTQAGATHGVHPAGDVCPFTGLRADGSLAESPAAQPANTQAPANTPVVDNLAGATRLPIPTAANDASSVVPTAIAGSAEVAAAPDAPVAASETAASAAMASETAASDGAASETAASAAVASETAASDGAAPAAVAADSGASAAVGADAAASDAVAPASAPKKPAAKRAAGQAGAGQSGAGQPGAKARSKNAKKSLRHRRT